MRIYVGVLLKQNLYVYSNKSRNKNALGRNESVFVLYAVGDGKADSRWYSALRKS